MPSNTATDHVFSFRGGIRGESKEGLEERSGDPVYLVPDKTMNAHKDNQRPSPPKSAEELLERYKAGERYFSASGLSEADLYGANFTRANLL